MANTLEKNEEYIVSLKNPSVDHSHLLEALKGIQYINVLEGKLEVGLHVVVPSNKSASFHKEYEDELYFDKYG